jgi:hypothetical protein
MYSPYSKKGEWCDCGACGRSFRSILPTDLDKYTDSENNKITLSDELSKQCYYCNPLVVYYSLSCIKCNTLSFIQTTYNSVLPHICTMCGFDSNKTNVSPNIIEAQPKMNSDAKELFNRIKKRNYGSNMPDY